MISAFTFVYNGLEGGYPFVEAIQAVRPYVQEVVVVDMASTDGTKDVLRRMPEVTRILAGFWEPGTAGACLAKNHALHIQCEYDTIWHFEADEVFDDSLCEEVTRHILRGESQIGIYRLQVSQNFQRCRWYPEMVHRVFEKGTVKKNGHTTDYKQPISVIGTEHGFLWDCTNCFRDNFRDRIKNNASLWGDQPRIRVTPYHFTMAPYEIPEDHADEYLAQEHWTWRNTPFNIPDILRPLVGQVKYEVK